MTALIKGMFIVIIITCVGLMTYSIINAIKVVKKNKAADEAARKIFLAKIEEDTQHETKKSTDPIPDNIEYSHDSETQESIDDENIDFEENTSGKSLKDFFVN